MVIPLWHFLVSITFDVRIVLLFFLPGMEVHLKSRFGNVIYENTEPLEGS